MTTDFNHRNRQPGERATASAITTRHMGLGTPAARRVPGCCA